MGTSLTSNSDLKKLVFLGFGQAASAVAAAAAKDFRLIGTTRSAEKFDELKFHNVEPILICSANDELKLEDALRDALVVVSFPPSPDFDEFASRAAAGAKSIVYISSTAVYGSQTGRVDETTEVDESSVQSAARLASEKLWLRANASIIRAPGIYGRGNGLHKRLLSGQYKLPGDGSNFVSRIHVDDLATMALRALEAHEKRIYLAGDELPTTHREIVSWLVQQLNLPFPESVPLENCHYTQKGNREVDARKSLRLLNLELKYPNYKIGYGAEISRG